MGSSPRPRLGVKWKTPTVAPSQSMHSQVEINLKSVEDPRLRFGQSTLRVSSNTKAERELPQTPLKNDSDALGDEMREEENPKKGLNRIHSQDKGFEHRTSLPRLLEVHAALTNEQRAAINSMGFRAMTRLRIRSLDKCLLPWIINCFDVETKKLSIHGKELIITPDVVNQALGIPHVGKPLLAPVGSQDGYELYGSIFEQRGKIVTIADTTDATGKEKWRISLVKQTISRLERIVGQWDDSYMHNAAWSSFKFQHQITMPQQKNRYDCGLYVCVMMICPSACSKLLSEEESILARRCLAVKMYCFKENRVPKGMKVDGLIQYKTCEHFLTNLDTAGLTAEDVCNQFMSLINADKAISEGMKPKLHLMTSKYPRKEYIVVENDLTTVIGPYIDMDKRRLCFKFTFEMPNEDDKNALGCPSR